MVADVKELFNMSREQLDELFKNSPAGEIPNGETDGTALIAPGTVCTKEIAECLRFFAWQGKVFDAEKGSLKNRVTAFGLKAVEATVYKGPSFLDNKECIIIDYSALPLVQTVPGAMRAVPSVAPLGISPAGLFVNSSSSCSRDILNNS